MRRIYSLGMEDVMKKSELKFCDAAKSAALKRAGWKPQKPNPMHKPYKYAGEVRRIARRAAIGDYARPDKRVYRDSDGCTHVMRDQWGSNGFMFREQRQFNHC